jgi:hypothetical protein
MIATLWRYSESRGSADGLRAAAIVLAGLFTLVVIVLASLTAPRLQADLVPAAVTADGGVSYSAPITLRPPFGFRIAGDGGSNGTRSNLELRENGEPLGPRHTAHAEIRSEGRGRYSHWGDRLWFSASDSTDPRSNGRTYSIAVNATVHPVVWVAVVLLDAAALLFGLPLLVRSARFRRRCFDVVLATALVLAALTAAGAFGRISQSEGEPKDVALVVATLLHALSGVIVLVLQWAAGAGLARLLLRGGLATFANVLIFGFMLSLPIAASLSAVALALPYGVPLAGVVLVLCWLPLWRWRPADSDWTSLAGVTFAVVPLAIAFGCWMGLLWHGPTETLGGAPSGDLVFYSTSIASLSSQLYPFRDLGFAYGPSYTYFNMLFPLLGAALGKLVTLDPFLFIAAAGGATFVLGVGLMLQLYVSGTGILVRAEGRMIACATVALAMLVATRHPFWVIESIPMVHAVPLAIGVVYWARRKDAISRLLALTFAVIGSALSKVVGFAVLVPFAAAGIVADLFLVSRLYRIAILAAAVAASAYAVWMLYMFGSFLLAVAPLGPVSVDMGLRYYTPFPVLAAFAMRDLAAALLAAMAFLLTDRLRAMAIAFGFLLFLTYPFVFQYDFVCAVIILALVACDAPDRLKRYGWPSLAAQLLALPAIVLTDPAGMFSGLVWLVCMGGTAMIALKHDAELVRGAWPRIAGTALLTVLGLVAVARGNFVLSSGWQPGVLTPSVRGLWLAVRDRTPADALIFTDQTGIEPTMLGGWNTYAIIGGRQIFVSSIYTNRETRLNRERAMQVLGENDAVLQGHLRPDQLPLPRKYSAYYAVVSCTRPAPPSWTKIFDNQSYCLYEMTRSR